MALAHVSPGEQLVELCHGPVLGDLGEDIGQITLRLGAVQLAGLCRMTDYAEQVSQMARSVRSLRRPVGIVRLRRSTLGSTARNICNYAPAHDQLPRRQLLRSLPGMGHSAASRSERDTFKL